jgi:hypothetical protein
VSSNPGREDCWIAEMPVVNMWSRVYILVIQCLSNLAHVRRVWVNNERPICDRLVDKDMRQPPTLTSMFVFHGH